MSISLSAHLRGGAQSRFQRAPLCLPVFGNTHCERWGCALVYLSALCHAGLHPLEGGREPSPGVGSDPAFHIALAWNCHICAYKIRVSLKATSYFCSRFRLALGEAMNGLCVWSGCLPTLCLVAQTSAKLYQHEFYQCRYQKNQNHETVSVHLRNGNYESLCMQKCYHISTVTLTQSFVLRISQNKL